jgi:hypothetical protein
MQAKAETLVADLPLEDGGSRRVLYAAPENPRDACPASPAGDAPKIVAALVQAPRKEIVYLQSAAIDGRPCEGISPHGHAGIEATAVARIAEWIGATMGR